MEHDSDSRIGPAPALVGWFNLNHLYGHSGEAMYSGPYVRSAFASARFDDPWQAVQWIAEKFRFEMEGPKR
jgi:hypothetical protein